MRQRDPSRRNLFPPTFTSCLSLGSVDGISNYPSIQFDNTFACYFFVNGNSEKRIRP
jgi:hypothetical protein